METVLPGREFYGLNQVTHCCVKENARVSRVCARSCRESHPHTVRRDGNLGYRRELQNEPMKLGEIVVHGVSTEEVKDVQLGWQFVSLDLGCATCREELRMSVLTRLRPAVEAIRYLSVKQTCLRKQSQSVSGSFQSAACETVCPSRAASDCDVYSIILLSVQYAKTFASGDMAHPLKSWVAQGYHSSTLMPELCPGLLLLASLNAVHAEGSLVKLAWPEVSRREDCQRQSVRWNPVLAPLRCDKVCTSPVASF